jgi:hypothetical protein
MMMFGYLFFLLLLTVVVVGVVAGIAWLNKNNS